nr:M4 family metallopeptidase [uncultured Flavobacterium sp.]
MKKTILFFIATLLFSGMNYAQVKDDEISAKNSKGEAEYIKFKETRINSDEKSVKDFFKKQFDLKNDDDFKLEPKHNLTENNLESKKYQQFYKGIKVQYAIKNVVSEKGNLKTITGKHVAISNMNITPKLTEDEALSFVLTNIGAKSYMWEDEENEKFIKKSKNNEKATYYPKAELVIIEKNLFGENPTPVLAYKFDIYSSNPISRDYVYIDANSGEIILKDAIIKHIQGSGNTRYSSQRTFETQQTGSQYRLRDYSRGNGIETYNMNRGTSYANATDFLDNDNVWNEYNNANKDNAALDAHWGAEKTYDYFLAKHNRNSYDGNGGVIKNYVHFSSNFDNAFWDSVDKTMTYGDGASVFSPLTSIDVIGHEIGHGVCATTADLIYSEESGAINESLSDIWGAMIEYFAEPSKQTYLIGEEIKLGGGALRSMSNPKSYSQPDTYKGTNWYTGTNQDYKVHTNSGIMNHWFYILSEGKTGTNDIGSFYNVAGISKEKAAKIVYRAETVYFNAGTNYFQARNYTIQATEDLYGSSSIESIAVAKAWDAVGVINYSLNGSYALCNENTATYTLAAPLPLVAGSVPVWSTSSNLTIISSNNSSVTVKSSNTNGTGFIKAVFSDGSIANKEVWVGKFSSGSLTGTSAVCRSVAYYYYANVPGGHKAGYTYRWTMPNANWQIFSQQDNRIYAGPSGPAGTNTAGQMLAEVNNGCGWSVIGGIIVYPNSSCTIGYSYIIYPNPINSSNSLTVEKINTNTESDLGETSFKTNAITETEIFEVEIKDLTGNTRIPKKIIKNKSQLDISTLQKGVYLLLINNKGEVSQQKIIIN